MDGGELFNEMCLVNPEVKAILISGYAKNEAIDAMFAKGLKGYISKPYTSEKLADGIKEILKKYGCLNA